MGRGSLDIGPRPSGLVRVRRSAGVAAVRRGVQALAPALALALVLAGTGIVAQAAAAARPKRSHAPAGRHIRTTHRRAAGRRPGSLGIPPAASPPSAVPAPRLSHDPASSGGPVSATAPAAGACAGGDLLPLAENLDQIRSAILCLVNQQRAAAGLLALRRSDPLQAAAQHHATEMVSLDYFAHTGPTGTGILDWAASAGYGFAGGAPLLGENIAAGVGPPATPSVTVAAWMGSPDHRAAIVDPSYRDTGVGVAAALPPSLGIGATGATYAELFGGGQ